MKALWLKITKRLVLKNSQTGDETSLEQRMHQVQEAMSIIRNNSDLKIEEILELFPKTTEHLNEMKEHICSSLDDHSDRLKIMRTQIDKHSNQTMKLRKQKRQARNKRMLIKTNKNCDICFCPALKQSN